MTAAPRLMDAAERVVYEAMLAATLPANVQAAINRLEREIIQQKFKVKGAANGGKASC